MTGVRCIVLGCALVMAACGGGPRGSASTDAAGITGVTAAQPTATASGGSSTTGAAVTTAAVTTTAGGATTTLPAGAEPVTFTTSDGLTLEGAIFGTGGDAVVLGSMGGSEMGAWYPFAEVLADAGFTAFAYNMRGHGGSEGGQELFYHVDIDAQAAIDFVRQRGAQRVFYFGASVNGVGAIAAGAGNDLAGVVDLSGPLGISMALDGVTLAGRVDEPKLFIVAEGDGSIPGMMQLVFDAAPEPKEMVVYSGDAHGTDLFGTHGDELTALLLDFARSN